MRNTRKITIRYTLLFLLIVSLLAGCGSNSKKEQKNPDSTPDTGFVPATPGNYDSMDRAVVVDIDTEAMTMTLETTYIGKKYTLYYDGATVFEDKYGQGMSLAQISKGELVDVRFMKNRHRLDYLSLANDAFAYNSLEDYQISTNGKRMTIGREEYSFSDSLVVLTGEGVGSIEDVNMVDVLSIRGQDHEINSIVVDKGHGYIRLLNDSYFVGGFLEVSQKQIVKIDPDMVITAPIGTYIVTVSNGGSTGREQVTVESGKEYEFDLGKFEVEAKYGKVLFTLVPEEAKVYIDGSVVDTTEAVELEYGIHQMIVIADGYQTISKYLKIGTPSSNLDVVMEANGDKKDDSTPSDNKVGDNDSKVITPSPSVSDNSASNNSTSNNVITPPKSTPSDNATKKDTISTTGDYKVYIDSPQGAEVYVDGSYVGIAPVSFAKKPGQIVVTLRKDGCQTRSYTLTIDSANKDSNYSFSALNTL